MNRKALTCLGLASALAGCSGGGSTSTPQVAAPQSIHKATGTLVLTIPQRKAGAAVVRGKSATRRTPKYISPSTTEAFLFIDGAAQISGGTPCLFPQTTCTITWNANLSTPATHSFAVEVDDGNNVLSEAVAQYAIASGDNGRLAPLSLNGVASALSYTVTGCPTQNSCNGNVSIADADNYVISYAGDPPTPPSNGNEFDNGPVVFTSDTPDVGTVSDSAQSSTTVSSSSLVVGQVNESGSYAYTVSCNDGATGNFGIAVKTGSQPPGDVTQQEIAALNPGVTYPSINVQPPAPSFTCNNGTIGTATGVVPLQ